MCHYKRPDRPVSGKQMAQSNVGVPTTKENLARVIVAIFLTVLGAIGIKEVRDKCHQLAIGISNTVNIEAGEQHACAILADNSIRCWGLNDNGQVGDGEEIEESYYDQDAYEWHYDRRLKQ